MALNLDISELTQAAATNAKPHDYCTVLDLGTGPFPRDIEVRLPDDDGARQNALWDGSLDLDINDEVLCFEYSGITAWRIMGMGGNDGGAGKVRVSEVWESDFGGVALETDGSGNVTINGSRTLTIPTDLIHAGDPDTKWSFTDDDVEITVGGLSMLKLTEAGQDLITLGPGSGDVDIDFNGDMFLKGSNGRLGLGVLASSPELLLHMSSDAVTGLLIQSSVDQSTLRPTIRMRRSRGSAASPTAVQTGNILFRFELEGHNGTAYEGARRVMESTATENWTVTDGGYDAKIYTRSNGTVGAPTLRMVIDDVGNVGLKGVSSPSTELDIGAGAIEGDEMTDPGAGAANTYRLFAEDDGAGKTRLMVRFATGAAQQIAIQP